MSSFIIKIKDQYLEWSTIVDAPVTFGMELKHFKRYYQKSNGTNGMSHFQERIDRADKTGSSGYPPYNTLWSIIVGNRAGPNESELTEDEIYQAYCLRQPIRDGWVVPVVDEE